jgi:hypothetical protein
LCRYVRINNFFHIHCHNIEGQCKLHETSPFKIMLLKKAIYLKSEIK